jgi:hypothetical protein
LPEEILAVPVALLRFLRQFAQHCAPLARQKRGELQTTRLPAIEGL